MTNHRFDADYFDRYYGSNPVRSTDEVERLAVAVHELVAWWGGDIRSMLEVGAGPGHWSSWYRRVHRGVRVVSTDVSEHACRTHGHQRRDISEWKPKRTFDLVVCMDVVQYLDDRRAARALQHLTAATKKVLFFDALTIHDAAHTVDREATDMDVHIRSGEWYRSRLSRGFVQVGVGLWVRKGSDLVLHELERLH